jgi:DNA-binding NtrC family response regulator
MRSRILFISERHEDARDLSRMLRPSPVVLDHVENLQQARTKLRQDEYDLILTEAALPDGNWLDALHLARDCSYPINVLVTDQHADARLWAKALNMGVYDLVAQPFYEPEVRRILASACTRRREGRTMAAV